jgi:uncharacterized membrane protein YbhN (UPF0104 family)
VSVDAAPAEDPRPGPSPPRRTRRRYLLEAAVAVLVSASAAILFAQLDQLNEIFLRIEHASPELLGLAVAFEALSFAGYVVLARTVFGDAAPRISWTESLEITLAGVVATRVLTAGGAGGIAVTAWALRGAGLDGRTAARRLAAFLVVLYAVFVAALLLDGAAVATGALGGGAPPGLALAGAAVGGLVIALALGTLLVPADLEQRAGEAAENGGRLARLADLLAPVPAVARESVALALWLARYQPGAVVAAVAWWAFDIAVLWSTFKMFGAPPAFGVLVLCYFLGQLAQVIPLPGGVGPVEGGMIGAFAVCGVSVDLAVPAVLSYQAVSRWLPLAPGLWGYLRLRKTMARWSAETR